MCSRIQNNSREGGILQLLPRFTGTCASAFYDIDFRNTDSVQSFKHRATLRLEGTL